MASDAVSLKLQLLSAKSRLLSYLQSHHNFRPVQREFLELVSEFETLKLESQAIYATSKEKVIPQLKSARFDQDDGDNRISSVSTIHQNAVSQLLELLDMHDNCSYLLELHQALISLESSVNQLLYQCSHHSVVDEKWKDIFETSDKTKTDLELGDKYSEIDEETYRLCVDAVITSLEESEHLFAKQQKFSKDVVLVFQSFQQTFTRCKNRLAQHVDDLWRRWIILEVPSKRGNTNSKSSFDNSYPPICGQVQSNDFFSFLFEACTLSPGEMSNSLRQPNYTSNSVFYEVSDHDVPTTQTYSQSSILASLKILAKPELVSQLLRIIEALKESKGRILELANQIWMYIFKPWLKKVPCTSGSHMGWAKLKCQVIEKYSQNDSDHELFIKEAETDTDDMHLTRYLHLSLIAPTTPALSADSSENNNNDVENLISSSCTQLTKVFQELYTYLFGLKIFQPSFNKNVTNPSSKRFIDLIVNDNGIDGDYSGMFNNELVKELIDGRFSAGLPSAEKLNKSEVIASLTQVVLQLIGVGRHTGFLTDTHSSDGKDSLKPSIIGGATKLNLWVDSLSILKHKRSANVILEELRDLLANRKLFYSMCPANSPQKPCEKKATTDDLNFKHDNDIDFDASYDEDELLLDENGDIFELGDSEKSSKNNQIISKLLKSKSNLHDISRHLDLGQFDFPDCSVSETVGLMMKQIYQILHDCESYLEPLVNEVNQSLNDNPSTLDSKKVNTIAFVEFMTKLIPRLIMLFTSLVPTLHADVFQEDLRFAVLYYNDCMYLAHECLTLGERGLYKFVQQFLELGYEIINNVPNSASNETNTFNDLNILERSASLSTCILVPHLRQAGVNSLLDHLRRERQYLLRCIERVQGFHNVSSSVGNQHCAAAIEDCCRHLHKIEEALSPLPRIVYFRAMGILCNCVCTELVKSVLKLVDITKSDCDNILMLLESIKSTITEFFKPCENVVHQSMLEKSIDKSQEKVNTTGQLIRRCPDFQRLQGVISVLSASSMAEIRDVLWNDGKGPLVTEAHITASELRCLVKALYSSSSFRDQLLQKLH
ncbi:ATP-dependent RNA helicase DDX55/SPB4 [Schistosoma japonicum]|nr:ATP-dependent RNA helicase DDX55/SPB4 [Schistosoma japonicum]